MPQQVEFERLDGEAGDQLQRLHRGPDGSKRFLVAMPVQQCGPAFHRRQWQLEATRRALAFDELFEKLGALGERLGLCARQYRREFVAQCQQTGRFQPDDRRAGLEMRG